VNARIHILCLLTAMLFSFIAIGQTDAKQDSVLQLIQLEKVDTVNAIYYITLGELTYQADPDTATYYWKKALEISEENQFANGMAIALGNLGYILNQQGKSEEALAHYLRAEKLALKFKGAGSLGDIYNNIGAYYKRRGDLDSALHYYSKGLESRKEANNKKGISSSYNNIGSLYRTQGDLERATEFYFKSLTIREEIGDKKGISNSLNNIGTIYMDQNDLENALKYLNRSLKIRREIDFKRGVSNVLLNIGKVYSQKGDYEKALQYYNESLTIRQAINYKGGIGDSYTSIGVLYMEQDNLSKARTYLEKGLKIYTELGDIDDMASASLEIARILEKEGDVSGALRLSEQAYKVAFEAKFIKIVQSASEQLSNLYSKKSRYKDALEMHVMFKEISDSLLNQENAKVLAQMDLQHKFDQQMREDSIQQAQKDLEREFKLNQEKQERQKQRELEIREQEEEEARTQIYFTGGIIVVVLLLGLAGVLFSSNRNKQESNKLLSHQNQLIEQKNKDITDSINYASRLQEAILPAPKLVKEYLTESFILFKPKDIVSGDFYWLETAAKNEVLFAAVDCTGHGVPGAMVSVVGANALNRCVNEFSITQPAEILNKLTDLVEATFDKSESEVKDGMDMALCSLNTNTNELQYAGANNPLWVITNDSERHAEFIEAVNGSIFRLTQDDPWAIVEIKANKQPIGKYDDRKPFVNHTIQLQKGDTIYIFSDGYADQFGGSKGKKFKYKQFKELLLANQQKPLEEQRTIINDKFEMWRGDLEQVDDVCIIGVRI
jgi:serine phosphatase RsbU (regulator of sigma subunit)/Tfp pilus assembly protein PilF